MPRALSAIGALRTLVTDLWAQPSARGGSVSKRFAGRFHPDLEAADVQAGGAPWIAIEAVLRARRALFDSSEWPLLVSRNARFDAMARRRVMRTATAGDNLFAYSYACTSTLASAADRGMRTVMGQIDGGPFEESIVLEEMARYPQLRERYRAAPRRYWDDWRTQCGVADRIVVNSPWAMQCLERAGIAAEKMVIVPLFYQSPVRAAHPRQVPARFDSSRPLRVLFLGQLNLRKGAARLFEAIRRMKDAPVEFVVVGPASVTIPEDMNALRNFNYAGRADRSQVHDHYVNADVFILPTLSDGFALTQLEAQAHGLPIIASRHCGPVVTHERNGLLLDEVSGESIAAAIYRLLDDPDMLRTMRGNAGIGFRDLSEYGRHFVQQTCS